MLACHIATPEEQRTQGALNGGVGKPQVPQQDRERVSALSRTDGQTDGRTVWAQADSPLCECGVGQPLLQAGRQKPDRWLSPNAPWLLSASGTDREELCSLPSPQH